MLQSKKIRICADLRAFAYDELASSDECTNFGKEDAPALADESKDLPRELPQEIAA